MSRCATCGRVNDDRASRCADCEQDLATSLAEGLLAGPSGRDDDPPAPAPAPDARPTRPTLAEALAGELSCLSCRTSVPPASRFCGVCGARLESTLRTA